MMEIEMQQGKNRRAKVLPLWYEVLSDYKAGRTAIEIANKHNKTRSWVYWVLTKFKNNEV